MEKAQTEVKTFTNKAKDRVDYALNEVKSKLAKAKRGELSIPDVIQQLRLIHLIILAFQTFVLYLEEGILSSAFFPLLLLVGNIYVVATRWHYHADSRQDIKGLTQNTDNPQLAAKYAIGLFGGFGLALIVNMFSPSGVDTILGSFFYNMSSYLSILAGAMTAGFEVYYGAQGSN